MKNIETKVIAATAGSGAGAAIGTFLLWLLGVTLWHASGSATAAANAVAAVPQPVADLVPIILSAIGGFVGGYLAPHTVRTDQAARTSSVTTAPSGTVWITPASTTASTTATSVLTPTTVDPAVEPTPPADGGDVG